MLKQYLYIGLGIIASLFGTGVDGSECQAVCILMRRCVPRRLTWIQTVCKGSKSFCPDVDSQELFTIGDTCYNFIETTNWRVTHNQAEADCKSRSGLLMTLRDMDTYDKVVKQLDRVADSHTILLGLKKIDGVWKWSTGDALEFEKFNKEKQYSSSSDCAKLKLMENAMWEKVPCTQTDWFSIYVCEHNQRSVDIASGQASVGSRIWMAVCTLVLTTVLYNLH